MRSIKLANASALSRLSPALFLSTSQRNFHHAVSIARLLDWKPAHDAHDVTVHGFIRSVRHMKSARFVSLGDGSSLAPLQALVPTDKSEGLTIGSAVRLTGSWVASPGAGQSHELRVQDVAVLGPSDAKTFPIQKKYQTPEYLRTMPHLRSRTPFNSAILRLRSEALASLTQFFSGRGFVQTQPPIITSSDCEGAGEVFAVVPANETEASSENEAGNSFFRSPKYLTVSSQLHLEALAQSVGDVWTMSPTFRAERSDTSRHLSEFYMLEAEMSFIDGLPAVMDLAEAMLRHLATTLYDTRVGQEIRSRAGQTVSDLAPVEEVERRWKGLTQPSWPRLTYSEAMNILSAKEDLFAHKPRWQDGLQSEHEKYIASFVGGGRPVFVTQYPQAIKAFYMLRTPETGAFGETMVGQDEAGRATVECFDLLVPEFCEIAGGSMRENRLPQLLESMQLHGLVAPPSRPTLGDGAGQAITPTAGSSNQADALDWYIDLRRWGCPPHGGFGLGFDRLLSYLSGVQTIRDVVAFPRWHGRCDC